MLEAVSEALVFGKKAGVKPEVLIEAISTGAARCWALEVKANSMIKRDFEPGFKVHLHHKDLKIAMDMGHDIGVPLPVTSLVHEMFGALKAAGLGNKDHSVIIDLIEKLAGEH
jgi:3-hydroxyisobutyrate dehydrogenase-like beta-hydroxyacid dehydrogenase